mmetsp:Transcript_145911/g.269079  ORF Transcript_145911/g.269079 Transcript_145911/m.269079 type:complete len:800 (+) Transcript_145911:87-2486(+)
MVRSMLERYGDEKCDRCGHPMSPHALFCAQCSAPASSSKASPEEGSAYTLEALDGRWFSLTCSQTHLVTGGVVTMDVDNDNATDRKGKMAPTYGRRVLLNADDRLQEGELTWNDKVIKWDSGEIWEREEPDSEDEDEEEALPNVADVSPKERPEGMFRQDTSGAIWDAEKLYGNRKPEAGECLGDIGNPRGYTKIKGKFSDVVKMTCSDELAEGEYGYPKATEDEKDPDWWREEAVKIMTDPRHNPNLLVKDHKSQEFWDNANRFPWAKTILRKEQHWNNRRSQWSVQYQKVNEMNISRADVCELLEDCPMDMKRLVQPILKYKIVEALLWNFNNEAKEIGVSFRERIMSPENVEQVRAVRQRLDEGGEEEAKKMQDNFDAMIADAHAKLDKEKREKDKEAGRVIIDMEGLKVALDHGEKCKKDGVLEWGKGNSKEALLSWRQGDEALKRFRAPWKNVKENQMIIELHSALLKNIAQACLKLENWNEAIDAADRALEMNDEDHKAWFRKACALEGLGKFDEAEACLEHIEEIAVGRPDRDRIAKDTHARREKIQAEREKNERRQQHMLQSALQKGIFGSERKQALPPDGEKPKTEKSQAAIEAPPKPEELKFVEKEKAQRKVKRGLKPGEFRPGEKPPAAIRREEAEAKWKEEQSRLGLPADQVGRANAKPPPSADRPRLTADATWDLLEALEEAYTDPWFRDRINKLIGDVRLNPELFMKHLQPVAMEARRPVLEKWGFEASPKGVQEMKLAIQDHLRGPNTNAKLRDRVYEVNKALYGAPELQMYERVHGQNSAPQH